MSGDYNFIRTFRSFAALADVHRIILNGRDDSKFWEQSRALRLYLTTTCTLQGPGRVEFVVLNDGRLL